MSYKPNTSTVPDGGTGVKTNTTAYAVLCAGTTATGPVQSIAGVGTSGQVLTSNGAGSLPTFQASTGSFVKIQSQTASASASIVFTNLSSAYAQYLVVIQNVAPATDDVGLYLRTSTNNGVSYDSGASDYGYTKFSFNSSGSGVTSSNGAAQIEIVNMGGGNGLGNAANESMSGEVRIFNPSATAFCKVTFLNQYTNASGNQSCNTGGGIRLSAADVDAIQFTMNSGNIASGIFTLYGLVT